jgi:ribose 5-phosphate isomerase B
MIYLGADHGGYKYKNRLKDYLTSRGYQVTDLGAHAEDANDDYPLIGEKVGVKAAEDPNNRGILVCRSGAGVCIVANKIKGIRAAQAWDESMAKAIRNDDNANVLCLGADYQVYEDVEKIAQLFLDMSFGTEPRFKRRLQEILEIEKRA